jgi:hypothetical protein
VGSGYLALNSSKARTLEKADVLVGYEDGETIILAGAIFATHLGGHGELANKYFHVGREAEKANHHVVLDAKKGLLMFDINGDAKGGVTVLARFKDGALPDVGDIVVA